MSATVKRPLPRPAPESVPYWQSASRHELQLPRCDACDEFWFPPSASCPRCLSPDFMWQQVSGRGKVFSFVTFHRVYHPAFQDQVPYVVALIELEEGPRLLSNIVGIGPEDVRCDMPVEVVFEDVAEGIALPKFTPVAAKTLP